MIELIFLLSKELLELMSQAGTSARGIYIMALKNIQYYKQLQEK